MKKLLVLALVLGLVSFASAAITTTVLVPGLNVIVDDIAMTATFEATLPATGITCGVLSPDAGVLTPLALGSQFGTGGIGDTPAALGLDASYNAGSIVGASASQFSGTGKVGVLYSFKWSPNVTKVTFLNEEVYGLGNAEFALGDGQIISLTGKTFVPEPMTMALLALGGLFLRKK